GRSILSANTGSTPRGRGLRRRCEGIGMNDQASTTQKTNAVTLTDNTSGKSWQFPIIDGTIGPRVIDIRKLYAETDLFTYDPGFTSTAACASAITYIDGDAGILRHRGYAIEDLAKKSDFMEVCYLLLYGELPTQAQKDAFVHAITYHTMVHEQLLYLYRGFR